MPGKSATTPSAKKKHSATPSVKKPAAKPKKTDEAVAKSDKKTKPARKTAAKKSTAARVAKGAAVQAAQALDTMAAGAVVGAVKAAAESVNETEAKGRRKPASTGKVLREIAPDAAMGALAGAARAMIPEGTKPAKPKAAKKSHR